MTYFTPPLFPGSAAPRPPTPPKPQQVVAHLRDVIRKSGGSRRLDELRPSSLMRWHKKLGSDLEAILRSVPWDRVEHPVSYLSAAVKRRYDEREQAKSMPDYGVYQGDTGLVVAVRHPDDPTRVREVLRGAEAREFLDCHANGNGSADSVPDTTS